MQRDLVGTPRRCTVGIFDRFAVVQLYKRLSAVCIVGIFRAPSVTGERVCQLCRLHISAENALSMHMQDDRSNQRPLSRESLSICPAMSRIV